MIITLDNYYFHYEPSSFELYCDGVKVDCVVAFDEQAGWYETYEADENNEFIVENDNLVIKRIYGEILPYGKRN